MTTKDQYYSDDANSRAVGFYRVFFWMFIGVATTGGVMILLPYILAMTNLVDIYMPLFTIASVFVLISAFIVNFALMLSKNKALSTILFLMYSINMGVVLSIFTIEYGIAVVSVSLLTAAACFGTMGVYGYLTKRSCISLGAFGLAFLVGSMILVLINIFMQSESLYWLISFIILAAMLAFTAYDVNYAKKMSQFGINESGAIYLALILYNDFIYIFIRILYFVGASKRK